MAQIFEADGEEGFRDVEAAVLNEVASYGRVVVSTGGGVVARPQNWGHLRNGIVVYLQAPVECVTRVHSLRLPRHRLLTRPRPPRQSAGCARGGGRSCSQAPSGWRCGWRRAGVRHGQAAGCARLSGGDVRPGGPDGRPAGAGGAARVQRAARSNHRARHHGAGGHAVSLGHQEEAAQRARGWLADAAGVFSGSALNLSGGAPTASQWNSIL